MLKPNIIAKQSFAKKAAGPLEIDLDQSWQVIPENDLRL